MHQTLLWFSFQTHNRQRRFTGALPPPMGHAVVVDPSQVANGISVTLLDIYIY